MNDPNMGWPRQGLGSPACTAKTRAVYRDLLRALWSPVVRWVWVFAASWGAVALIVGRMG